MPSSHRGHTPYYPTLRISSVEGRQAAYDGGVSAFDRPNVARAVRHNPLLCRYRLFALLVFCESLVILAIRGFLDKIQIGSRGR